MLLQLHFGLMDSVVYGLGHFIQKISGLVLEPGNTVGSSDIVSVFTMVPVQEVLGHLSDMFLANITALFWQELTTTYFQWDGGFYEQTDGVAMGSLDGVAMGSPLNSVVVNLIWKSLMSWQLHLHTQADLLLLVCG